MGCTNSSHELSTEDVHHHQKGNKKRVSDSHEYYLTDEEDDAMSTISSGSVTATTAHVAATAIASTYRRHRRRRLRMRPSASAAALSRLRPADAADAIAAAYRRHRKRRQRRAATVVAAAWRRHRTRLLRGLRFRGQRRDRASPRSSSASQEPPKPADVLAGPLDTGTYKTILEQRTTLAHPVLHTTTTRANISDSDIEQLCGFFHAVVERGGPFIFLHDLRELKPWVSRAQLGTVRRWVNEHSDGLQHQLQATCIVVRSTTITVLVNWLIRVIGPTQPTRLVADLDAAQAFLALHFACEAPPTASQAAMPRAPHDLFDNPLEC